jgi:hypothetical protein
MFKAIVKFIGLIGVMYFCICLGYYGLYSMKQYESLPARPFVRQIQTIVTQPINDLLGDGLVSIKSDWDVITSDGLKGTQAKKLTLNAYSNEFINKSVVIKSVNEGKWALAVCQTSGNKVQECRKSQLYSTGDKAFKIENTSSLENSKELSFYALNQEATTSNIDLIATIDSSVVGSQLHLRWF